MSAPITTPDSLGPESTTLYAPEIASSTTRRPRRFARPRRRFDEDDQVRAPWEKAIGWVIVAICTITVFYIMDPNLRLWPLDQIHFGDLFTGTTTNGGDMGAHVWWPWFLEHHWFSWNPFKMRLAGWAPDWYAGFPVGQYYFPVPALMVAALDQVMHYNVAFKLVTVSGPLMLPAAAYTFAKGLKAPWPAPPAFAVAAFGTLVQTRNDWQIYGGNIASTLAGEFSFCIALAFALFGLGALAYTLDTGKRRWLPAVLIAAAIMSHIVVAIFIVIASFLVWITRRPLRTWRIYLPVGIVAGALTASWLLPLIANNAYTQSMRYSKLTPKGSFTLPSWLMPIEPIRHTIENLWNGWQRPPIDPNTNPLQHFSPTLWIPWWMKLLALFAFIGMCWYRRRSTFILFVLALIFGIMFVQWPEFAIWNTRFLPFWLLSWALICGMGATELIRAAAGLVRWVYSWIREGDLQDARAQAWAAIATAGESDASVTPEMRRDAAWVLAERRFDRAPPGWSPPSQLASRRVRSRARLAGTIVMTVLIAIGAVYAIHRGWDAKDDNSAIQIRGWAAWNYSGYQNKTTWPQFDAVLTGMQQVADQYGPGRALWEPSSGDPDAINSYGTSLALELLPMFTNGKVDSMEGIYFESSATTSYHFLMVAECSEHPSDPVRGLVYGTPEKDFDLCVKHMQMLGVKYFMTWTPEVQRLASANPNLTLVKNIPQNPPIAAPAPDKELNDWKVYKVAGSDLVVPMTTEPVVATHLDKTKYSDCWSQPWTDPSTSEPKLSKWECAVAPWWVDRNLLKIPFAQSGPSSWTRVPRADLASAQPRTITDPPTISNIQNSASKISFDTSEIGKPVEVRESYYPNWQAKGAKGPYRLAPNMMVVIPTSTHVELTYGFTRVDYVARAITVAGVVGLVLLALWSGARFYAAGVGEPDEPGPSDDDAPDAADAPIDERRDGALTDDESRSPPDGERERREPSPALP